MYSHGKTELLDVFSVEVRHPASDNSPLIFVFFLRFGAAACLGTLQPKSYVLRHGQVLPPCLVIVVSDLFVAQVTAHITRQARPLPQSP